MDVLPKYSRLAVRVMSILRPDGIQFGGGYGASAGDNLQNSGWFHYRFTQTSGVGYGSGWTNTQDTGTMSLPARAKVFVYTNTPTRGDTNSWGGMYEDLLYSVNGGSFTSVGRAGFVCRMMTNGYPITNHADFCVFDFTSITSDFTLQLRTASTYYNSGGQVNTSCGLGGGDNNTSYDALNQQNSMYKQIIVWGFGTTAA